MFLSQQAPLNTSLFWHYKALRIDGKEPISFSLVTNRQLNVDLLGRIATRSIRYGLLLQIRVVIVGL